MAFTGNPALLIAAPMLQDYLVDKTTGFPLAAGIVTLYHDNSRTTLKSWYYQTGQPGAYTYIELFNPLTLSSVGTIQDPDGNDVIPFYYPYDDTNEALVDPYYVVVQNSGLVPQFTRANFPFVPPANNADTGSQTLLNLLPNGQFLSHNNLPTSNDGTYKINQVQNGVQAVTIATQGTTVLPNNTSVIIAQGGGTGWYFVKPIASTDNDFITFTQIGQEPGNLSGNPRYYVTLACNSTSGSDTFKELRVRFNNVNRFASDTQTYTFSMQGMDNNVGTVNINLNYIKYFGDGGSAPTETTVATYTLQNGSWKDANGNLFTTTFTFGSNSGKAIGTENDDYVEISLSLPSTSVYSISLDNMLLTPGTVIPVAYPERPDYEVLDSAVSGSFPTPNPDGSDLYLPLVLTPAGTKWSHSTVGDIVPQFALTRENALVCDGTSYLASGYSDLGIPYSRLQAKMLAIGAGGVPISGTGYNFVTGYVSSSVTQNVVLGLNRIGSATAAVPTDINTGFSFTTIHTSVATGYDELGTSPNAAIFIMRNLTVGTVTVTAGNSGFAFTTYPNNAISCAITSFTVGSPPAAGHYFTFTNTGGSYYVWYQVNGTGADPAPGGTGILVKILSTDTTTEVARKTALSLNGGWVSNIGCLAGSSVVSGSYFTFSVNYASAIDFFVWFNTGSSIKPVASGTGIEVTVNNTMTAAQVATALSNAINSFYIGTPDLRGMFLRGYDPASIWDIGQDRVALLNMNLGGTSLGGVEFDRFQSHVHSYTISGGGVNAAAGADDALTPTAASTGATGGSETNPVNTNINWFIIY